VHARSAVTEVHRILIHQGQYITIGVHPCFYGSFAEAKSDGTIVQHPGYRDTTFLPTSAHGSTIHSRVGAWHRPPASLINAFTGTGFNLVKLLEDGPNDIPNLLGLSLIKP
jgi:hypothetical protein